MQYAFDKIDTVAGYETLLASAQKKKRVVERQLRNLAATIDNFKKHIEEINSETATVQTLLSAYNTAFEALPQGKDKAKLNVAIKRLEVRQALADKRALTYNVRSLLMKQVKYNMLLNRLTTIDTYINSIERRITEFPVATAMVTRATTASRPAVVLLKSQLLKRSFRKLRHVSPQLANVPELQILTIRDQWNKGEPTGDGSPRSTVHGPREQP
jgi:chromosome segregation ATPase